MFPAILVPRNIIAIASGSSSRFFALLVLFREREVMVVSGREDKFEVDMEGGDSFAISGLLKENSVVHFFISK